MISLWWTKVKRVNADLISLFLLFVFISLFRFSLHMELVWIGRFIVVRLLISRISISIVHIVIRHIWISSIILKRIFIKGWRFDSSRPNDVEDRNDPESVGHLACKKPNEVIELDVWRQYVTTVRSLRKHYRIID